MSATATPTVLPRHAAFERAAYAPLGDGADTLDGTQAAFFEHDHGRMPRSAEELDAYSSSDQEFADYMATNPVPDPTPPAPAPDPVALLASQFGIPADKLGLLLSVLKGQDTTPKPSPAASPTVLVAPPPGTMAVAVDALSVPQMREAVLRKYGFTPFVSWTAEQLRGCLLGHPGCGPSGRGSKDMARLACLRVKGHNPPASWSAKEVWEYVHGRKAAPRGKVFKAEATGKYVATYGEPPPVSWSGAKVMGSVESGVRGKPGVSRPGTKPGEKRADGLTMAKCQELIKAALANGAEKSRFAGRSKLNADQLRDMVRANGLV